ncbi:hypothetical protein FB45DRAFT_1055059 [Roridomyces roridus]|uniref:STB6-like N-terminal domain-containing protein n=1 Tax=Roridomyces roridus TaxID=1738132 RepID=A0AAD7C4E0_9AGAR|nr:hypothetical protein FB45DRAFT_1055059 [Roridomyces roridus]
MQTLLLPTVRNPQQQETQHTARDWIGLPLHFHIVTDGLELDGYQIYAVQKWIVERRPVTVLTVYTGDPAHKITVTALRPSPSLSPAEATAEWDKAILHLRRDARPRETAYGTVLATSLAHFRSDYTIVNIPNGDFLNARDQLYTNINLLRMGCSGRTSLTLEEPSQTTKDRFIASYHLPDSILSSSAAVSNPAPASPKASPQKHHRPHLSISPPTRRSQDSGVSPTSSHRATYSLQLTPSTPPLAPLSPSTTPSGRYASRGKTRGDRAVFGASVLELVRLLQASLAIFGLFSIESRAIDGLLCDKTVEGLSTWVTDIGEQCVNLEATERIADPGLVCALLSLVLTIRNKLVAMGLSHFTPKDPFLRPQALLVALGTYNACPPASVSSPATPAFPFHLHSHSLPVTPTMSTLALSTTTKASPAAPMVLTRALYDSICSSYSDKAGERRRTRGPRALLGLDGELSDPASGGEGADPGAVDAGGQILTGIGNLVRLNVGGSGPGGAAAVLEPSVDLEAFVRMVVGRDKSKKKQAKEKESRPGEGEGVDAVSRSKEKEIVTGVAGCVRGLWSGLVSGVVSLRERELEAMSGGTMERGKDRWAPIVLSDGEPDDSEPRAKGEKDGRSTEEEGPDNWGGRVQKKFESWTRLSRIDRKKGQSVDLSSRRDSLEDHPRRRRPLPAQDILSPLTFARGDTEPPEEDLSSGQVSPVNDPRTPKRFDDMLSAASSAANLNAQEYDRKLTAFNRKRPWGNRLVQNRVSSWSDPVSAREHLDSSDESGPGDESMLSRTSRALRPSGSILEVDEEELLIEEPIEAGYLSDALSSKRRPVATGPRRRRSWHQDFKSFKDLKVLSPEHMRIDVQLCGQVLVMCRREEHLRNVLACVRILTASLSETNARLREEYQTHVQALAEVEMNTRVIADMDLERSKADKILQAQNTISYETQQFQIPDLWHIASGPRHTTFAVRDKVFGMGGRRLPTGKHGAHGAFNRVQWTLNGETRFVDELGRTESEAEEENIAGLDADKQPATEDEEDTVISHPAMRPMWLLRFFTSWAARWSARQPEQAEVKSGSESAETRQSISLQDKPNPIPTSRASI